MASEGSLRNPIVKLNEPMTNDHKKINYDSQITDPKLSMNFQFNSFSKLFKLGEAAAAIYCTRTSNNFSSSSFLIKYVLVL